MTEDIVLATFQYSKMAMWEDLEQLRLEGVEHELIRALCGQEVVWSDPGAAGAVFMKRDDELKGGLLDDFLDVKNSFSFSRPTTANYWQLKPHVPVNICSSTALQVPARAKRSLTSSRHS